MYWKWYLINSHGIRQFIVLIKARMRNSRFIARRKMAIVKVFIFKQISFNISFKNANKKGEMTMYFYSRRTCTT